MKIIVKLVQIYGKKNVKSNEVGRRLIGKNMRYPLSNFKVISN